MKKNKWIHISIVSEKGQTTLYWNGKKKKFDKITTIAFWIKAKGVKRGRKSK